MKTKFFKKLSFVLVVAMVLSLFVPAAGAFAAAGPKLNSTNKYLHLGRVDEGQNEFNFNIKNKKSGWKYFWESANEAVAEVNEKNGVTTATGVGKTKVTVTITDKDGEEVDTLSATVTVRDNIKEVTISNPVEKLAVGEEHDYNRSYVTESGSTKKTSSITRWTVTPDTATIDDKGVFVATAGGEYTVTALSFQSKARYDAWVKDPVANADEVLDTDETKVVVSASIVDVKQVNLTKFNVEFDSSMADTDLSATTAKVYQVIGGKQYNTGTEKIKSVTLDAAGKVATIEIYGNLVSKGVYQFTYGDLAKEFNAADTDIKNIAGLVFSNFEVKTKADPNKAEPDNFVDLRDKVSAVNSDGVVIKSGQDIKSFLNFEYKGEYTYGWLVDGYKAYINKDGYSAEYKVKYNNFVYDDATKTYKPVELEATAVGVGVEAIVNYVSMQYAVTKTGEPASWSSAWATEGFRVPASDQGFGIYTRYKQITDPSWAGYRYDKIFTYDTTNSDKLVVSGGYLYPIAEGVVTVLVKENNVTVGAFDLTIVGSRGFASAEVVDGNYAVSLGNHIFTGPDGIPADSSGDNDTETRKIFIMNKDSMGEPLLHTALTIGAPTFVNGPTEAYPNLTASLVTTDSSSGDYGKVAVKVNAAGAKAGAYQYKINLTAYNTTKTVHFYVNVLEGQAEKNLLADVQRWEVELSSANVDLKKINAPKNVNVHVYGYNANNARIYALNNTEFKSNVVKSANSGVAIKFGISGTGTSHVIEVARLVSPAPASGPAFEFVDKESYNVNVEVLGSGNPTGRAAGSYIGSRQFAVVDTTELIDILENPSVSESKLNVAAAVKQAFKFKINGNDINESTARFGYKVTKGMYYTIPETNFTDGAEVIKAGDNFYVHEVSYTTNWGGGDVTYTFKVGKTITITK